MPGDRITIQKANKLFKPKRKQTLSLDQALGKWLVKPYLHYVVGSEVTKEMIKDLKLMGINNIEISPNEPAFRPAIVQLNTIAMTDRDWMRRLGGERLRQTLGNAVSFGQKSSLHGTS